MGQARSVQEPADIPPLSRPATVAVVLLTVLPLVAVVMNTAVLLRARTEAGPPPPEAILPLPDGYVTVSETEGCTPGNWVRCYRVVVVERAGVDGPAALAELAAYYGDRHGSLYSWRGGWRHPDCSRDVGTCVALDRDGAARVRIEVNRMSDGL